MPDDFPKRGIPMVLMKFLLVLLFVIWSNAFTAVLHLREVFSPARLILARFLPVCLVCLVYLIVDGKRREESIRILRTSAWRIVGMGVFGIAGYNFFLFLGQSEIKPGAAALITTLSPLFTLILSVIILKSRVPLRRTVGVLMALGGMYFVIRWGGIGLGNLPSVSNAEFKYALITALAPLSWSLYTVLGKRMTEDYEPVTISSLSLIIGTIPFILLTDAEFFHSVSLMRGTHWLALGHLSILCTIVGYWIWNTGLKYLPATSVASFIYLNPPMAAIFGWLFFGEEVTYLFIAGSVVILLGLYLAQKENGR